MNKLTLGIVGVVIVLVTAVAFWTGKNYDMLGDMAGDLGATSSTASTTDTTTPTKTTSPKVTVTGTTTGSLQITSPRLAEQWVFGETHQIQWTEESKGNGSIVLVDGGTGQVVGYLSPTLTLHQKAFTWNTRDVLLNRTGGQKKDIPPGNYVIRVNFETAGVKSADSALFSVITPSQKTTITQTIVIKSGTMNPAKIQLKTGDKIFIVNNDAMAYKLLMVGFSPITINAGETFTYGTSHLTPGTYDFYSTDYPNLKTSIVIVK